jgi:hypothetical protein
MKVVQLISCFLYNDTLSCACVMDCREFMNEGHCLFASYEILFYHVLGGSREKARIPSVRPAFSPRTEAGHELGELCAQGARRELLQCSGVRGCRSLAPAVCQPAAVSAPMYQANSSVCCYC